MYCVRRAASLSACGLLLAACSASDYSTPVAAFSDATTAAASSFKSSRESVEKFVGDRRLKLAADGGKIKTASANDCIPGAQHCRLVVTDKNGRTQPLNLSLDNLQSLMDGLNAYTKSLVDIVKADNSSAVNKALDNIKTNLTGLVQDSDTFAKQQRLNVDFSRVTPFIAPLSDAATFVIGKALEAQKLAALRGATSAMEQIFEPLTVVFKAVNSAAIKHQQDQMNRAFRLAQSAYGRNPNESNRQDLIKAAAGYDAILKSDPKDVFDALREAHGVLAKELNEPNPSFDKLWTLLQRATEEAAKLAEINKAFQKALNPTQG